MCTTAANVAQPQNTDMLLRFVATLDQIARSRETTTDILTAWGMVVLIEDAKLVLTELLSNALTHAHASAIMQIVREEKGLLVRVWDPLPDMPTLKHPDHLAEKGRGLHIVKELSSENGCYPSDSGGKVTWARLIVN